MVLFCCFPQVIYHCTVRTLDGVVVESTRSECGGEDSPTLLSCKGFLLETHRMCFMFPSGRGLPIRDVLGKSKMILGLLEGIPTMHKAEIAMVTLQR